MSIDVETILDLISPCGCAPRWCILNGLVWAAGHGFGTCDAGPRSVVFALGHAREVLPAVIARQGEEAGDNAAALLRSFVDRSEPARRGGVLAAVPFDYVALAEAMGVDSWRVSGNDVHPRAAALGFVLGMPQCFIAAREGQEIRP